MKLKTKFFLKEREGEEKIVHKFLWLPTSFGIEPQARWLEFADVVYKIEKHEWEVYDLWEWCAIRFATNEDLKTIPLEKCKKYENSSDFWNLMDLLTIPMMFYSPAIATVWLLASKLCKFYIYDKL